MDEQTIIIRVSVLLLESTFPRVNIHYLHVSQSHRLSLWLPQAHFGLPFIIIKNNQFRQTPPQYLQDNITASCCVFGR